MSARFVEKSIEEKNACGLVAIKPTPTGEGVGAGSKLAADDRRMGGGVGRLSALIRTANDSLIHRLCEVVKEAQRSRFYCWSLSGFER
jgi:hypothetical protein